MDTNRIRKILSVLREQDEAISKIFREREALRKECQSDSDTETYDRVWERLHADGKSHWDF